jgi:hypothetical protein
MTNVKRLVLVKESIRIVRLTTMVHTATTTMQTASAAVCR